MMSMRRRQASDSPERLLVDGVKALGLQLPEEAMARLLHYVEELSKWNSAFNLTAVRAQDAMVTRHLLDSLAALPAVEQSLAEVAMQTSEASVRPKNLIDIGSGAGLPAIPFAIAHPEWSVFALDSNGKKARFMRHAQRILRIENLQVIEERSEMYQPEARFDIVISRAFASLVDFLRLTAHLGRPDSQWLAMKGRLDSEEVKAVPKEFSVVRIAPLTVPGLAEARHLVILGRRGPDPDRSR
jgi:16S rRNA (guanine527-N7)-methyltransferase